MTLYNFLLHETYMQELCVICENGYVAATCWIDHEDRFQIPQRLKDKEVVSDKWGKFPVANEYNETIRIPCHYIKIGD